MQITRNSGETATGPSDWFTGTVYIDTVAEPAAASRHCAAVGRRVHLAQRRDLAVAADGP